MPEPIRSERYLIDPVRTRLFISDEDDVQVPIADIDSIDVYAYEGDESDPFFALEDLSPNDLMFDTLRPWPLDDTGYNFEHWIDPRMEMPTGELFDPKAGTTTLLEYVVYRPVTVSGVPIFRTLTFQHLVRNLAVRTRSPRVP